MDIDLSEKLSLINGCTGHDALKACFQSIIEGYGFCSFAFSVGDVESLSGFSYLGTVDPEWVQTYMAERYYETDPVLSVGMKTNSPFRWDEARTLVNLSGEVPATAALYDAVRDYGYLNGYVVPFHFVDSLGRPRSSLVSLFFEGNLKGFNRVLARHRQELDLLVPYWLQHAVNRVCAGKHEESCHLLGIEPPEQVPVSLSGRERTVLTWTSRGKTAQDIADILGISLATSGTHIRNINRKLGSENKAHSVAKAIYLGLINP